MSSSTTQPASTDCFTTRWARSVPRRPFAALALVLLTFCHDDLSAPRSAGAAPGRDVLDGARGGGNPHFFFLQPIVATTPHSGTFDATELPIVEICALTNGACATPLVATYTMTSGFGSQTIRVSTSDQSYLVNWKTSDFTLDQNAVYRIRVKVLSTELGHAIMPTLRGFS